VPQLTVPPQPSAIVPQLLPCVAQVVGVQVVGFERMLTRMPTPSQRA